MVVRIRISYNNSVKLGSMFSPGLLVFAGLLGSATATTAPSQPAPFPEKLLKVKESDPRVTRLKQFFTKRDCPVHKFAEDFVSAADENNLDWRLLPSISFLESGGGKDFVKNNVLGWDSCKQGFASIPVGIHTVARSLGKSTVYRNKDLNTVLRIYNPRGNYPEKVKSVMRTISMN